jgi:hypothetical protein
MGEGERGGDAFKFARAHASIKVSSVVSDSGFHESPVSQHWRLGAVTMGSKNAMEVLKHFRALLASGEYFFAAPPGNNCYSYSCFHNL